MKVLFFGIYDPKYARNRVLREGFERNGWTVTEVRVDPREYRGLSKYWQLAKLAMRARREKFDMVLVCFPGQTVMPLARLLFGKRAVFDAFLSLYDSNVFDRRVYGAWSIRGRRDWLLDAWSSRLAWKVLLETNAHIDYFVETFHVPREKFERIWISADDTVFKPADVPEEARFTVHFHGMFIPLQGVSYIIRAAALLRDEDIRFRMIGAGQDFDAAKRLVAELKLEDSIEFTGKVPVEKVPEYMAKAQVVLGIFGDTPKTKRVIPNKVYEAMAMGKAIITADTPVVHELPGAAEALSLVPVADPQALADAICALKDDESERQRLGSAARAVFDRELLPEYMVKNLLEALKS
ncbi:hypothetical protein A2765_00410 [Candidatus Kaiserbacteria bacterium RIFCSPHIGHO2_01_FULL_56_24]|uniref:Glycosyl transferase family 1 domain-containing protein n=1 Tax=Candidatus Kaiserbacteria bacterium RIFCSPHIGHO2_01_FULL_56_24 TaxID=1798487 RepID=A0A1F6DBN6_9BACT|nr:MAG: hypothetical protein A2765_00410 [Candidatus Kaiserbacteria bacterium RIFCSPHIGHO2_01_FULL_56_24]